MEHIAADTDAVMYEYQVDRADFIHQLMMEKSLDPDQAVDYLVSLFKGPEFTGDLNPQVENILMNRLCDISAEESETISDETASTDDTEEEEENIPDFTKRVDVLGNVTGLSSRLKYCENFYEIHPVRHAADAVACDDFIIRFLLPYIHSQILLMPRLIRLIRTCMGPHGDALMPRIVDTYAEWVLCIRDRSLRYFEIHNYFNEITDDHKWGMIPHRVLDPVYPDMEDHHLIMPVHTCNTTTSSYPKCIQTLVNAVYEGLSPIEIEPALRLYDDMLENGLDANRLINQFIRADSGEIILGQDWLNAKRWFFRTHGTESSPFDIDSIPTYLLVEDDHYFPYATPPTTSDDDSF